MRKRCDKRPPVIITETDRTSRNDRTRCYPLCAIPDRLPSHRRRADRAVQLALCAQTWRQDAAGSRDTDRERSTDAAIKVNSKASNGSASSGMTRPSISSRGPHGTVKSPTVARGRQGLSLLRQRRERQMRAVEGAPSATMAAGVIAIHRRRPRASPVIRLARPRLVKT